MLAYDIGCYNGDTTDQLLKYYDKIICVDANPYIINEIINKYDNNKSLEIIEGCISNSNKDINFYISDVPIWSSSLKEIAERENTSKEIIKVKPININDLIDKYGCPYYLKCDIEGADIILLEQLLQKSYRPKYISCESECIGNRDIDFANDEDLKVLNALQKLGYTKFILVNQFNNAINESNAHFNNEYDFNNLNDYWLTYDQIKQLMRSINRIQYSVFHFWFDIIATY